MMWWQARSPVHSLVEILAKVNISREKHNAVDKCSEMFDALNKVWNEYFKYRRKTLDLTGREIKRGRTDTAAFTQLMMEGLTPSQRKNLLQSPQLKSLVHLDPLVMNHGTLMKGDYDPNYCREI